MPPLAEQPDRNPDGFRHGRRPALNQLLGQQVDRAQDAMSAQNRLRELLRANRAIVGDLALPVVLRRIVEAGCALVQASYGALGVIAPDGGLDQFISVGMDEPTRAAIGPLPRGKGLLGALIDDPRPIRLTDIAEDPRSVGLPPHHPPMTGFLGVPILVRDEVFGNLYLTRDDRRPFTAEDEELVSSLAATAGIAIENARLFEDAQRKQTWLAASTEITRQLLSSEGEEPLHVVARRLQEIAGADAVNVVLPTPDAQHLMVEVATGQGADHLTGLRYPIGNTVSNLVLQTGRPVLIADMSQEQRYTVHLSEVVPVGALMALPLVGRQRVRGAVIVGRLHGRAAFTDVELDMASTFANHAALALELADARSDQQRVVLLEDRDRIARDLHDHVIQRLFASGLTVESVASGMGADARAERLARVVEDIDDTIRQIRTTIFRLRGPLAAQTGELRSQMFDVAAELAPRLGFQVRISSTGPVDAAVSGAILDDLVAVVREALTNVARHAEASSANVDISATGTELSIQVTDDGIGIGDATRRSGLANLEYRAEDRGGTLTVTSPVPKIRDRRHDGGTSLRWTIPLS